MWGLMKPSGPGVELETIEIEGYQTSFFFLQEAQTPNSFFIFGQC